MAAKPSQEPLPHKEAIRQLRISQTKRLGDFVTKNFRQRKCTIFVENPTDPKLCHCNRDREWHIRKLGEESLKRTAEEWSVEKCTKTVPTVCYGQIKLHGFGRLRASHRPKFIRMDAECESLEHLWELFVGKNYWNMPVPELILSINGGAKKMRPLSRKMEVKLKNGIMKLASGVKSTWIITGGFNFGVVRLLGQAVQDYVCGGGDETNLNIIGVSAWGAVFNNCVLKPEHGMERSGDIMKIHEYFNMTENPGKGQAVLEPNHTHFLLCDDGTQRRFGNEIRFRGKLESFLVKKLKERQETDRRLFSAPVVQIVIEGGKVAILTAGHSAEKGTPVVTVKDSGRAADVLAWARNLRSAVKCSDAEARMLILKKVSSYDDSWRCSVKEKGQIVETLLKFGKVDPKADFDSGLLSVFHGGHEEDLERTILYTLLQSPAYKKRTMTQLMLAMAWNRADIAEQEIFSDCQRATWSSVQLDFAMEEALLRQQKTFVELFLDHGISVTSFLTKNVLQRLYEATFTSHSTVAERLLRKLESQNFCSRRCFNNFFSCCRAKKKPDKSDYMDYLLGNELPCLEDADEAILHAVNRLVEIYTDYAVDNLYTCKNLMNKEPVVEFECCSIRPPPAIKKRKKVDCSLSDPDYKIFPPHNQKGKRRFTPQDLFLWALLNHNLELAFLFWRHGKDQIGSALIGYSILKNIAADAGENGELELQARLDKDAVLFEELAIGVLSICNEKNKDLTRNCLIRKLPYWNKKTVMELAERNQCMDFLYLSCVQGVLTNTWSGGMESDTPRWRVFICILFPILIPRLIFNTNLVKGPEKSLKTLENLEQKQDTTSIISRAISDAEKVCIHAPNAREYNEDLKVEEAIAGMSQRSQRELRLLKLSVQRRGFKNLSFFTCLALFYSAPRVKYALNVLSTIIFLMFSSYLMLVELKPFHYLCTGNLSAHNDTGRGYSTKDCMISPHWTEIYVLCWAVTYVMEELRQFLSRRSHVVLRFREYSVWDWIDVFICFAFVFCLTIRVSVPCQHFDWVKSSYALTLSASFLRFMHFYYAHPTLGPKVVMIINMMGDLIFFICIIVIFILSYGVASLSLLTSHTKTHDFSFSLFKEIFYRPYWQMYGELFLDGDDGIVEDPPSDCNWLVILLFAMYMLLSNVLLLNLLIAMFGYSFEKVQSSSHKYWAYIRHDLIQEYYKRPVLPPPFIFISHLLRFVSWLNCSRQKKDKVKCDDFSMDLDLSEHRRLSSFEQQATDKYCREKFGESAAVTQPTLEKLEQFLESLSHTQPEVAAAVDSDLCSREPNEDQLQMLEKNFHNLEKKLNEITRLIGTKIK